MPISKTDSKADQRTNLITAFTKNFAGALGNSFQQNEVVNAAAGGGAIGFMLGTGFSMLLLAVKLFEYEEKVRAGTVHELSGVIGKAIMFEQAIGTIAFNGAGSVVAGMATVGSVGLACGLIHKAANLTCDIVAPRAARPRHNPGDTFNKVIEELTKKN